VKEKVHLSNNLSMATSWGSGNTDFKFYQGSSSSNAWTRDLLWKRAISDEAKLMGFKPSVPEQMGDRGAASSLGTQSKMDMPPSPRKLPALDTSRPLPSARSSNMQHHLRKMRQKLQTQETRQRAILDRAEEMFHDRKKFGGKLNRKEADSWSTFMNTLKAPTKHISPATGELDPRASTISQTRFDSIPRPRTSGSTTARRNRFAQTRSFVALKNRRAANRAAIAAEKKQLLQGGRAPPFWTDDVAQSQLGGRPATMAQGLYGKPVDEIVPRYGSVTDLPVYDTPKYWEEEGELQVGEVLAPLPGMEDSKEMYKSAYRLSFVPKPESDSVAIVEGSKQQIEVEEDEAMSMSIPAAAEFGERYALIPELTIVSSENEGEKEKSETVADQSALIISKLESEQKNRLTARGKSKRGNTRGSSRKTARPSGLTGRPYTVPTK
jgi:hypothetical protein